MANHTNQVRLFDVKTLGEVSYEDVNQAPADISVVIPLYNYAHYINECLLSVATQDILHLSIIVVDDCSTDGGGEVAVRFLEQYRKRFATARVVRHRRNQGLAMSRNSGISWSLEPFLFMLDADNRIRPPALSRLLEAVLASQAEFAYSQLSLFGSQVGIGDADIWDPERFRARGNYIDGMALIKREALLVAGGYRVSALEEGWEDFDLWCRFAELGYRGIYLPELVCEYRVHEHSMLRTRTDSRQRSLSLEMALRHPGLLARGEVPPFVELCSADTTSSGTT
jgi:glycosyltransferase involved in cell wall biosynthesis